MSLKKLINLERDATQFGFKWENAKQILDQIRNECTEVQVHLNDGNKQKLQEEIGDLLHAAYSLCVFCELDPQQTLENSVNKFEKRFMAIKELAKAEGFAHLNGHSFETLMQLWDKAKKAVG